MRASLAALIPNFLKFNSAPKGLPMNAPEKLPVAASQDQFVTVPETVLPGGLVVPAFRVGKFLSGIAGDKMAITADAVPMVRVSYAEARIAARAAGYNPITESQYLALAYQIASQDENWTGGKVGAGMLFQGLRKGRLSEAKAASYCPKDSDERRWFLLPGGERIYDVAGNAYSWVFDDIQGNADGIVSKAFAPDSPSIVIPYPNENKGQGWTPSRGRDGSGRALVRGGCWFSGSNAGVFHLDRDWPVRRYDNVGFRCTQSGL